MRKISYLLILAVVAFSACTEPFKKAKDGTEYKIVTAKGGKLVTAGNFMEMNVAGKYGDSVLFSSLEEGMPDFQPYDTTNFPPLFKEIFKTIHVGDSIIIRVLTDSIIKKSQGNNPPWMKKGKYITQTYTIVRSFATQEEAEKARTAAQPLAEAKQKKKQEEADKKEDKILTDYFAKNNIKVQKTPLGAYVEIIQQGTGPLIDTSNSVKINYTGKTFEGKQFDSNTQPNADPARTHLEPILVNLTNDPSLGMTTIPGWNEGLKLLSKGAKAKFYIPSSLGYGRQGNGADIAPNTLLIFDIEVIDVLNKAQAKVEADAVMKKMQDMQKRFMDSMQKVNPQPQVNPGK